MKILKILAILAVSALSLFAAVYFTELYVAEVNAKEKTLAQVIIQNQLEAEMNKAEEQAKEELGEGASEDEILNRSTEMLVNDLARAELTTDIFEKWETNNFIQEKLMKKLYKKQIELHIKQWKHLYII